MTVTPGADPVIRVRGLTKRYGDVEAVAGIDFDVAKGEIFGLLRPNGAGRLAGDLFRDRLAHVPLAVVPGQRTAGQSRANPISRITATLWRAQPCRTSR